MVEQCRSDVTRDLTVKAGAEICGVATSTSFRWCHRLMTLLESDKPWYLTGIVEADETYFRKSHKGARAVEAPRKRGSRAIKAFTFFSTSG